MKVLQIVGHHNSGKTTVIKEMVKRLKMGNKIVATIKEIHDPTFQLDTLNTNSHVHKTAGADVTIICAEKETDFLYYKKLDLMQIVNKISADWLLVEGFHEFPLPKIVCAKQESDAKNFIDERTLAVAGLISHSKKQLGNLPVFNAIDHDQADQLFELISSRVFPMLPYVEDKCCQLCGLTCSEMVEAIVQGKKKFDDCLINQQEVNLKIGDRNIKIVPFVQKILKNNVLALVQELDGWEKGKTIKISIN